MSNQPQLVVVGGPNGSGKTTVAVEYAAETGYIYLGADAIAAELSPAKPELAKVAAGRAFIRQLRDHIASRNNLIVESTLSGVTLQREIAAARSHGYRVLVAFVFVDDVETCINRVAGRVRRGGHDVPEADIRRRFPRSMVNFWNVYQDTADHWDIVYNKDAAIRVAASGRQDQVTVFSPQAFAAFMRLIDEYRA